jgi:hypothetical protein
MKLHQSVIEHLIYLVQTYGGYEHESKLRQQFNSLDLTPYERKTTHEGEMVLVRTEDMLKKLSGRPE